MINRPQQLTRFELCNGSSYCAIGWLAHELKLRTDGELGLIMCSEIGETYKLIDEISDKLNELGVTCTPKDLHDLMMKNDGRTDRVGVFNHWCVEQGIELAEEDEHDQEA
jgi:hypothetical protein